MTRGQIFVRPQLVATAARAFEIVSTFACERCPAGICHCDWVFPCERCGEFTDATAGDVHRGANLCLNCSEVD